MKKIIHGSKLLAISVAMALFIGAGIISVNAWTEPTGDAPTGNLGAPINTSDIQQTKGAGLIVNSNGINGVGLYSNGGIETTNYVLASAYSYRMPTTGETDALVYVNATNKIYLGRNNSGMGFRSGGGEKMTISSSGLVGIGNSNPLYSLDVTGGGHFTTNLSVVGTAYASAFMYSSDERLKNNINNLRNVNDILNVSPVTFNWNKDGKADTGVIAQEVEKYFPEFVSTGEDGFKAVNYPKLVVPLIGVVKEQQQRIDDLEKRLEVLENK